MQLVIFLHVSLQFLSTELARIKLLLLKAIQSLLNQTPHSLILVTSLTLSVFFAYESTCCSTLVNFFHQSPIAQIAYLYLILDRMTSALGC